MTNKFEVALDRIKKSVSPCDNWTQEDMEHYKTIVEALEIASMQMWIPVTERLPEKGERVLATDGGFVGEMYINKRGQWQRYNVNDSALMMALDILWWMPMPLPPKETVYCKDCEHLMFSDCYGECGAAHKGIVQPNDTCEYAVKRKSKEDK